VSLRLSLTSPTKPKLGSCPSANAFSSASILIFANLAYLLWSNSGIPFSFSLEYIGGNCNSSHFLFTYSILFGSTSPDLYAAFNCSILPRRVKSGRIIPVLFKYEISIGKSTLIASPFSKNALLNDSILAPPNVALLKSNIPANELLVTSCNVEYCPRILPAWSVIGANLP
jgi:hypothetical protein